MPNGTRSKTTTGALITDAVVRPVQPGDEAGWRRLYAGYADFYRVEMNDSILASTWSWLLNEDHPLEGLIAVSNDVPVGLAHYRAQPKPLLGRDAGFLDDLFVDPASRGAGVARLLVRRVAAI